MENQFTIISYNKDDLQLIKKALPLLLQKLQNVHNTNDHLNVHNTNDHPNVHDTNDHPNVHNTNDHPNVHNTNDHPNVHTHNDHPNVHASNDHPNVHDTNDHQNVHKKDIVNKFHIIIYECIEIDILNKSIIKVPTVSTLPNITIDFTDDNTVLINNNELSIPFQIKYIKVFGGEAGAGVEAVDSINFIKELTYNKTKYIININSNKYHDYIITDDKYMKNVDEYYNFINEYCNRDKKVLTPEEIIKKNKFNELNIKINMTVKDIENFIDELNDEFSISKLEFDIENWKKKDYIILRTLNDLLIVLFMDIMKDFNTLCKNEQIKIIKQLINNYLKYYDNIVFFQKCSFGNSNIYITIIMKVFEFYTKNHIFESILCFIKYAPQYCNENFFPVPSKGKITIDDEHEMEILNNKYLRQIYLDNKHYLV